MPRTVAALFDSRAEAEFARGRLVSRLQARSPRIIAKDTVGALDAVDIAADDKEAYRAKLRDGSHLLVAEAPSGVDAKKIIDLLEDCIGHADPRADQQWGDAHKGVRVELPSKDVTEPPTEEPLPFVDRKPLPPYPGATQAPAPWANRDASKGDLRKSPGQVNDQRSVKDEPQSESEHNRAGGARVRAVTHDMPAEEQVTLLNEMIDVENRPSERRLSDRELEADGLFQERVIEVAAMREVPVVTKVAVVREEVIVRKTLQKRTETIRDTVRKTDIQVEDLDAPDHSGRAFFDREAKPRGSP